MTAPKPKVVKVLVHGGGWAWYCGCGYVERSGSWEWAIGSSTEHSRRRHAAERIVDHLKAEKDDAYDDLVHMWAFACDYAADLIRKHLT